MGVAASERSRTAARSESRARPRDRPPFAIALAWGTAVALVLSVLAGILRVWLWILALEPLALGFIVGEAAAVPSSVKHRRPPRWSYAYVFLLACGSYLLVHVSHWLAVDEFVFSSSFLGFLASAPSSTGARFFQEVDLARQISLATGGAAALKYWLWAAEGLLMGTAAILAYRGGSIRRLKS
jgi:hypothetical protein